MRRVHIDFDDRTPIYEQVAAAIRRDIASGEIGAGERLPPARDLAAVVGVNPNTVLRALRVLRDEGILDFRRGLGITVSGDAPHRSALVEAANALLRQGRKLGYRKDEIVKLIANLP